MTATTLSRLPLAAGSVLASQIGRAGLWAVSRYMRAPAASTGLLALVTLTALAGSNALYFQTSEHPAPFFAPAPNVPAAVSGVPVIRAPVPALRPEISSASEPAVTQETTGSVALAQPAIPDAPVGNRDAFAVQKKLAEIGLFSGTVDGFYGPRTAQAIRAFEERNGLEPTGALTPDIIDAITRADAQGKVPVAQPAAAVVAAPAPQPAIVQQAQDAPAAQPVAPAPDQVVARVQTLTPVDRAVDTVGSAAAQTIDSIVAAVGGVAETPAAQGAQPIPALPVAAAPRQQPMPAPVKVASLENMAPPQPVAQPQTAAAPTLAPANNTQLVSQIQRGLASLGFYHDSIDGHPGDSTARAIREFENFHSYKVTGQVNPDLVGLLLDAGASI